MVNSRQEAYENIIRRAIPLANRDDRLPVSLKGLYKLPDRPEVLEIQYDPDLVHSTIQGMLKWHKEVRSEDELMRLFVQVARDAVQEALSFEPESLGYLMLEQIRYATSTGTDSTI